MICNAQRDFASMRRQNYGNNFYEEAETRMGQSTGRDDNDAKPSAEEGATPTGPPAGHTLEDHEYGDVFFHEHGPDADHDLSLIHI